MYPDPRDAKSKPLAATLFRNFAMRAWLENNTGGLKKDFDTWFKGLSVEACQVNFTPTQTLLSLTCFAAVCRSCQSCKFPDYQFLSQRVGPVYFTRVRKGNRRSSRCVLCLAAWLAELQIISHYSTIVQQTNCMNEYKIQEAGENDKN